MGNFNLVFISFHVIKRITERSFHRSFPLLLTSYSTWPCTDYLWTEVKRHTKRCNAMQHLSWLIPCNKGASFLKQSGCVNATNLGSSELQFTCLSWCWKRGESWHRQCIFVLSFPSMFSLHIIPLFCRGKFSLFQTQTITRHDKCRDWAAFTISLFLFSIYHLARLWQCAVINIYTCGWPK